MICKYCKSQIDNGSTRCPYCDKPLKNKPLPVRMISALRDMPARNWVCVAVLLVAGIIALAVFLAGMQPDPFVIAENTVSSISDGKNTALYYNGASLDGQYSTELLKVCTSCDGNVMTFMEGEVLYLADKKGVRTVSENVVHYQLSPSGDKLAYINSVGELYRYSRSSGKSTLVDYNVLQSYLCIASDGTLAYLKQETAGDVMYYCTGKKPQKYAEGDRYPVSVSDGAKHIYTVDGSMNLYYRAGGKESPIGKKIERSPLYLNKDGSHITFVSDGATYAYSAKSGVKRLADAVLTPVTPAHTESYTSVSYLADDCVQTRLGINNFAKKYFTDSKGNLYYTDKKYSTATVASAVAGAVVSVNGKRAFYLTENGSLMQLSGSKATSVAEGVTSFAASHDGRYIYYIDEKATLYCKHGRLSEKLISENVGNLALSGKDYLFFTVNVEDGVRDLYAVKGRGGADLVCSGVSEYRVGAGAAYYLKDGVRHFSKADLKFKER